MLAGEELLALFLCLCVSDLIDHRKQRGCSLVADLR